MEKSIKQLKQRRELTIQALYRLFILNENIDKIKQEVIDGFILNTFNEEIIEYILKVIDRITDYKIIVSDLLSKNWSWERLPKIIQAIFINAIYEIKNNINPKAIIINESIELTRQYLPGFETKFVNGLLDNIS